MDPVGTARPQPAMPVVAAIARAATSTGERFDFLLANARLESGLDPSARARTSSAAGLFQFVERTWLDMVRRHGAKHGLGWAAAAIEGTGRALRVADPALRTAILKLREDAAAAAAMAAELTAENREHLARRLGRPARDAELYLAHVLGVGGATRFLKALQTGPDAAAAHVTPRAARTNPGLFFDRSGRVRSLADVFATLAARLARAGADGPHPAAPAAPAPARQAPIHRPLPVAAGPSIAPQAAHAAYLLLARLGA